MANKQTFDYRDFVHKPDDLATEYAAWARDMQAAHTITWGVPSLDEKILPFRPGNEIAFLARPGNLKTSLLVWFAITEAQRIISKLAEDEIVVYVTYEQTSEELTAILQSRMTPFSVADIVRGRVDVEQVMPYAIEQVMLPIWIIGHGLSRNNSQMPRMTPEVVYRAIETIYQDYGKKIVLLCFDYMQLIPVQNAADRVAQVTEVPIRIKELAMRVGCPALMAVQAGREVDNYGAKIPQMRDAQWASSIEQTCDAVFGLWRPWQTEKPGSVMDIGETSITVTENLFVMRMLKQRFESGRWTWALSFDPGKLELSELSRAQEPPI
jgi:replicative DNA helicase